MRKSFISNENNDDIKNDLFFKEDVVVTLSYFGYIKSQSLILYNSQKRGGIGKNAVSVKYEDYIVRLLIISNDSVLLCFSNASSNLFCKVFNFLFELMLKKKKYI